MNRIGFHEEDGVLQTYWEEVTPIEKDKAAAFALKDKPAYLQIFFHRPMDEEEIRLLYSELLEYNIIEMTDEDCEKNIQEDLGHQPMGTWEFRCTNFSDVFNCACKIGTFDMSRDGSITFQISDEPTSLMKRWLENKNVEKKIASALKKLVERNRYVDVGTGVEKSYGVSRERFNSALKRLQNEGYHVSLLKYKDKKPFIIRILSRDVLCKNEIIANKEMWKEERIKFCEERNDIHEPENHD